MIFTTEFLSNWSNLSEYFILLSVSIYLGVLVMSETTVAGLTELVLNELEKLLDHLRAQGYDNDANVKGKHCDTQSRISVLEPREFFRFPLFSISIHSEAA